MYVCTLRFLINNKELYIYDYVENIIDQTIYPNVSYYAYESIENEEESLSSRKWKKIYWVKKIGKIYEIFSLYI